MAPSRTIKPTKTSRKKEELPAEEEETAPRIERTKKEGGRQGWYEERGTKDLQMVKKKTCV